MKLTVDYDLCEANGICAMEAPDVFALDDSDLLHVRMEHVDETRSEAIARAVRMCPRGALRLED